LYGFLTYFLFSITPAGTQDILMFLKNGQTIREKKTVILSWIQDSPSDILKLAKKANTATPLPEYVADLQPLLLSKFRRSCRTHHNRSPERERAIVRYVVYMQLQMMDRMKTKKPGPLVAHRNPETPVDACIRVNNQTERDAGMGPSSTVVDQMNKSSTFFDRQLVQNGTTMDDTVARSAHTGMSTLSGSWVRDVNCCIDEYDINTTGVNSWLAPKMLLYINQSFYLLKVLQIRHAV
jgi:hypothetical protein